MADGNLKVIFHGQFAFVVHSECIEVLMPEVARVPGAAGIPEVPGHTYSAGADAAPGTGNIELRPGESYQLRGVDGGDSVTRFPRDGFPIVEDYKIIDRTPSKLHGSIYLPFPNRITGLRQINSGWKKYFSGAAARQITASRVPLLYVFTYTFDNSGDVALDETPVLPAGHNELHFFAEPQTQVGLRADHAKKAFRTLVRLFPGLDLKLIDFGSEYLEDSSTAPIEVPHDSARSLIEAAAGQQLRRPNAKPSLPICMSLVVDNA